MRHVIVLAALAVPTLASAAAVPSILRGSAAVANLHHVSGDGCVHTVAEIAVVQVRGRGGELSDGLYIVGSREDVCAGTGNGYAGFFPGSFTVAGLRSARAFGTFVVPSYSGGAPVTFELDATWTGRGPIARQRTHYRDEYAISFSSGAWRDAAVTGTLTADGDPLTVDAATLRGGIEGTISLP